jgi:hypothetical protein
MKKMKIWLLCFLWLGVLNVAAEDEESSKTFALETDFSTFLTFERTDLDYVNAGLVFPIKEIKMNFKVSYLYLFSRRTADLMDIGRTVLVNRIHDFNLGPIWYLNKYMYTGLLLGASDQISESRNHYQSIKLSPMLSFTTDRDQSFFVGFLFHLSFEHMFLLKGLLPKYSQPFWNPLPFSIGLTTGLTF